MAGQRSTGSPTRHRVGTFAQGLVGRSNAFGLLRLILALLVIVSHAFPVGGWGKDPMGAWTHGQAELGDLAVVGFFAVSGYLITRSARRTPLGLYLWRRFLRIMPAFWLVLLFTALVVGPLFYARGHGDLNGYFDEPGGPSSFIGSNFLLMMRQFTIHDVFADAPMGGGVLNGSLWTLFFEALCYLIVAALAVAGLLSERRRWVVPVAAAVFYAVSVFGPMVSSSFTPLSSSRLGSVFLTGATFAIYNDRIPFTGWIASASVAVVVTTAMVGGLRTVGYIALSYLDPVGGRPGPEAAARDRFGQRPLLRRLHLRLAGADGARDLRGSAVGLRLVRARLRTARAAVRRPELVARREAGDAVEGRVAVAPGSCATRPARPHRATRVPRPDRLRFRAGRGPAFTPAPRGPMPGQHPVHPHMSRTEIVLVSYHSSSHVEELVAGWPTELAVVVVDNARGVDGLEDFAGVHPNVRYVDGGGQGFGRAANLGAFSTEREFVVFVNPDCRPSVDDLESLVAGLASDPGAPRTPPPCDGT
ncbi:MAG: acyltransferase family protein [Micropruina sp.]